MKDRPDLTITIVSWNTKGLLRSCLESVKDNGCRSSIEVYVVDNGSSDGSVEMVTRHFPGVIVIENDENLGFARANNQSWSRARGRYWLLLNSDAQVRPGALDRLVRFMDQHPRAGLASARLVSPDSSVQYCAQRVPGFLFTAIETARLHKLLPKRVRGKLLLGTYWSYDEPVKVGWAWGTALIARREAVDEVGPLSEKFFMYGEDLEWCMRMGRRGWETWFCPEAEVVHCQGGSSAKWTDSRRFLAKMDGLYLAICANKGPVYVRLLQGFKVACLGMEWTLARIRGRASDRFTSLLLYYWQALRGPGAAARLSATRGGSGGGR